MRLRSPVSVLLALLGLVAVLLPAPAAAAPVPAGDRPISSLRGLACQRLALPVELPLALAGTCPGVRPGALVRAPLGLCSLNFLWRGSDGFDYIGTAGHCVLDDSRPREVTYAFGQGPPASDAERRPIGRIAYAVQDDQHDFALIRLDPGVAADPQVCFIGGPVGTADDLPALGGLRQVGQGRLFGSVVPVRSQLALGADPDQVLSAGLAAPGDSGSPLLDDTGRAVGIVVATGPALLGVVGTGIVFSTRLQPQIERATEATGVRYELRTAPRTSS